MRANRASRICALLSVALASACLPPKESSRAPVDHQVAGGAIWGNPKQASQIIVNAICGTLTRCAAQATMNECQAAVLAAPINLQIGAPSVYPSLVSVAQAERDGVFPVSQPALDACSTAISRLSCDNPTVQAAYVPGVANPYAGVQALIPAQPGSCNDVYSDLQIGSSVGSLSVGAAQRFSASGGVPPYAFSLVSGSGTITSAGAYVAPAVSSVETVRVTDSLGHTSDAVFTVGPVAKVSWIGKAGADWKNPANWAGGAVPGPNDLAVFDSGCVGTCAVAIASDIDVGGIAIEPTFPGSLSQIGGATVMTEAWGFTQDGAAFIGGTGPIVVNNGALAINRGAFTSTRGVLTLQGNRGVTSLVQFKVSPLASFSANQGTVSLGTGISSDPSMDLELSDVSLNNLVFGLGDNSNVVTIAGSFSVLGVLTLNDFDTYIDSGTIYAYGNVSISGPGPSTSGGDATLALVGSNGQTLTGTAGAYFPSILIAAPANSTVNLVGKIGVFKNWTYRSGIVNAGTSTVQFGRQNTGDDAEVIDSGSMKFNHVNLVNSGPGTTVVGTMNVGGNLVVNTNLGSQSVLRGGTVAVSGNVSVLSLNGVSGLSLSFVGPGNASFTDTSGSFVDGLVTLAKPQGTLTLQSNMILASPGQAFDLQSGTLFLNGHALSVNSTLSVGSAGTLNCGGGCGTGTACGQGLRKLVCSLLDNQGVIVP